MSKMLESKRATRGLRMSALIGEAAEQDDTFWNNEVWAESESDDSFSDVEVKPDVFDSDFNDTEDDDDESDEEAKVAKEPKQSKGGNKYKEPGQPKRPTKPSSVSHTTRVAQSLSSSGVGRPREGATRGNAIVMLTDAASAAAAREVRRSTKEKSKLSTVARSLAEKTVLVTKKMRMPQIKHQFTQKELLRDALTTEKANQTWLESQKIASANDKPGGDMRGARQQQHDHNDRTKLRRRLLSRRGAYNTITFTADELIPDVLKENAEAPEPREQLFCVVTSLPAKYRDPLSGLPYATIAAFKQIRREFAENDMNMAN